MMGIRSSKVMRKLVGVVAVVLAVPALMASPAGAQAQVSVSPGSGLDPAGTFVVVSGAGFEPNSQLFVMQCRSTSTDDHTCNSVGLRKVTTDAGGNFTANAMRVTAHFGATDCLVVQCAIKTSAVSGHAGNRSQDVMSLISFSAPAPAPPPAPAPTAPPEPRPDPAPAPASPPVETPAPDNPPAVEGETSEDAPAADEELETTGEVEVDGAAEAETETADADATDDRDEAAQAPGDDSAALVAPLTDTDSGSGGSGTVVWVVGALMLALVGAGGAVFAVRRRNA